MPIKLVLMPLTHVTVLREKVISSTDEISPEVFNGEINS